jgi:hypothetical protein
MEVQCRQRVVGGEQIRNESKRLTALAVHTLVVDLDLRDGFSI